mmetsp:Transcript_14182/g.40300  ORF Transcript_14182/g.40300 Transcript_14182/m.40300 type:complete len:304 (-) Transcript_14182:773-1684(-)|eukprot:CAMPEP_0119134092 /NCGR_PEP_ID=MMETSP1310-20130426/15491_1 /TAXON_ID=464262 /ORGANISM="Genus nov. species nov., Strain RCC2339" /LENGTH=303 /DNA_ID=CAMNT_0007124837 /DNA_START=28 /DNA_END=939 /DNA_ORIENTATION=-
MSMKKNGKESGSGGVVPPPRWVKTSGAMVGGVVEACMLQPLDVLKTRIQLEGNGLGKTASTMFRNEGPRSFYKGLTPFVTHLVTKYSVRWYFNEFYREFFRDEKTGKVSTFGGFAAGLGSGLTEAVLIVTPFEVVKIRLQKQKGSTNLHYHGPVDCVQKIVRNEGVRALWKGNLPTMARQGINQLLLFGSYDYLKKGVFNLERNDPISSHQSLVIGIIAGALGPLCNNPFDVAKTRLMAQETQAGQTPRYRGTIHCISSIWREEGARALMSGCMMRIIRVAPGMGITFVCVEKVSSILAPPPQ